MNGQTPVYVMNQTMQREQGHKAQLSNIAAAKAVADIIRTTLGPRSMLKMLLDPLGGIVMTNDGNAILREINVSCSLAPYSSSALAAPSPFPDP
jgi:T-complex protein 1 subunit gamma